MTEVFKATQADDLRYMRMALDQARQAAERGEIPIGAVVVSPNGRVIGRGHNLTETLSDVTAHAEMQAITAATQTIGGKYLQGCTLYVTVEPCLMCAGAIGWAQIGRIVYGTADAKRGYSTFTRNPFHPRATIESGVAADEATELMKEFFSLCRERRR
ncbi:MAG: nucleoside deaminase [Paramuribaculum sp.]|nr:nucleoside deaminase [Paramuribaculum sp.]MDE7470982.1 nucleoside deaminase [Paramuribaculum sp.]